MQAQLKKTKITVQNIASIPDLKFQDKEEFSAEIQRTENCKNEKAIIDSCLRGPFIHNLILIPGNEIPYNIITPVVEIKVFQKKGSSYEVVYNVYSLYFKDLPTFIDACPKQIREIFFSYYQFKKETFGFDYHPSIINIKTELVINDYKNALKNTAILRLEMYLDPDNPEKDNVKFYQDIKQPLERIITICEQGEVKEVAIEKDFLALIIRIFLNSSFRGIRDKKLVKQFPKPLNTKFNFIIVTSKESENVNLQYEFKIAEEYNKNIRKISIIIVDILLNYDKRENIQTGIFQYYSELIDKKKGLFSLNIVIFFQSRLPPEKKTKFIDNSSKSFTKTKAKPYPDY